MLGIPRLVVIPHLVPVLSLRYCSTYLRSYISQVRPSSEATTTNLQSLAPSFTPSFRNSVHTLLNLTRALYRWQRVTVTRPRADLLDAFSFILDVVV